MAFIVWGVCVLVGTIALCALVVTLQALDRSDRRRH